MEKWTYIIGLASVELGYLLLSFYYLSASEIWTDKRWPLVEELYKRGTIVLFWILLSLINQWPLIDQTSNLTSRHANSNLNNILHVHFCI